MRHRPMRREDRDKDYEYVGLQRGQLYDIGNHLPLVYRNITDVVNEYIRIPEERLVRPTKNRTAGVICFILNNRIVWFNHLADDLTDKRHWMYYDAKRGRFIGLSRIMQYAEEMLVYHPTVYNENLMVYKVIKEKQELEYMYQYDLEKISTIFKCTYKKSTMFNVPVEEIIRDMKNDTDRIFRN